MKRFRFNLDALLRIYAREEEERKRKLGEANRTLMLAEAELKRLGEEYDACQHEETTRREKGESLVRMKLYLAYVFDLKGRIEKQKQTVKEAIRQVKVARDKLIEAKRRLKAIERIKEKRFQSWKKERNRFEAKVLDDLCQQKYIREHAMTGVA
jgi:flagellar protein FliJ